MVKRILFGVAALFFVGPALFGATVLFGSLTLVPAGLLCMAVAFAL
jgi:hypothetical protein